MGVILHWFLPTNGDSRTDLSLGNAVGAAGSRAAADSTGAAPSGRRTSATSARSPGPRSSSASPAR